MARLSSRQNSIRRTFRTDLKSRTGGSDGHWKSGPVSRGWDRAIGKSRLSRLLVDRTVDYYADHRPSLPTEPERLRLDELGAQVYAFLRYRATGAFLEAHRTDDGYDLTIAALSEDDEMRRHIERRLGRRVLEDGELRLARTRSDREES